MSEREAAERLKKIDAKDRRYASEIDGTGVDGWLAISDEELESFKALADAYLAIADLVTPEVREAAERIRVCKSSGFHDTRRAYAADEKCDDDSDGTTLDVAIMYDEKTLTNFALAVIERVEGKEPQ